MTLQEWDKQIAPHLQRIESIAESIGRNAQYVKAAVMALPLRPAWQTRARDSLDQAGAKLLDTLKKIHDAREAYDSLSVIDEDAA